MYIENNGKKYSSYESPSVPRPPAETTYNMR